VLQQEAATVQVKDHRRVDAVAQTALYAAVGVALQQWQVVAQAVAVCAVGVAPIEAQHVAVVADGGQLCQQGGDGAGGEFVVGVEKPDPLATGGIDADIARDARPAIAGSV